MVDQRLLDILCCPVSKRPLRAVGRKRLAAVNEAIAAGDVLRVDGQPRRQALDDALQTDDGQVLYPVDDGIPVLLADEAIGTAQFTDLPD